MKAMRFLQNFLRSLSVAGLSIFGLVTVFGVIFLVNLFHGLPGVSGLKDYHHANASEVFSDDGKKIGEFTTERRYPVKFEAIPKHVILSFLAAEDSRFYEHGGIDYTGILRAVYSNLTHGRFAQGGSTITQQVARGILLETRKKEITRKIREMILAWQMEHSLSKAEILNLYLSEIYLGHGAFGIGAASRNYFNKKVEDLSIAESALLAGLPQRPNEWDPFRNPAIAKRRQLYVLKRMVEEKFITEKQREDAERQELRLYRLEDQTATAAPYFTEYVRQYLMNKYGSEKVLSQGYRVYTTVRYDFQKLAEKSVDKGAREVDKRLGWRGTLGNLADSQKMSAFEEAQHEEILDKVIPIRILATNPDAQVKRLAYDFAILKEKNSPYAGATPVKENEYYKAVVHELADNVGVTARIGRTPVVISTASMNWVRVNGTLLTKPSQFLKVGDIIQVRVERLDRKNGVAVGSLEQEPEIQGALLSFEHDNGFVRAMVGGLDFAKSKFNCALQAKRQVGSTFKPVIYSAAFDKGFSPSSIVTDAPLVFKYEGTLDADNQGEDWRPHNYGGKFEGDIPLRLALIRSMNIPTIKLLNEITVDYGIQYARNLGITAPLPRDLTIGLGSWSSSLDELMRAYAVFPRLGRPSQLVFIRRVEDANGNLIEEYQPEKLPEAPKNETASSATPPALPAGLVISPQTAFVMTDLLRGVVREGTGRAASSVPAPIAGKTGTSNDHRDAWFIGYSPQVITGVWIGYEKDKPLDPGETGGRAAAPIFAEYMSGVVKEYPKADFPIPDDVVFAYVDKETGLLASSSSSSRVKVAFKVGTVPNRVGDNLPRVGEPGVRMNAGADGASGAVAAPAPVGGATGPEEETSDILREGYQE